MKPRQLVLFVEGEGDKLAAPILLKRLLRERDSQDLLVVDPKPMVVGELSGLRKQDYTAWRNYLDVAIRTRSLDAGLLLLDGDSLPHEGKPFCARDTACELASVAQKRGAGTRFSTTVVFAKMEFESWLIAGAASLAGKYLADGSVRFPDAIAPPNGDLEISPRNAKGFFHDNMSGGYRPARHQASITELIDLNTIRQQNMRSFRRLENAVDEIIEAFRNDRHVVSPVSKS